MEATTENISNVLLNEMNEQIHAQIIAMGLQPKTIDAVKKVNWFHIRCDGVYAFRIRMKVLDSGKRIYKVRK
jgi:hypothetical protein